MGCSIRRALLRNISIMASVLSVGVALSSATARAQIYVSNQDVGTIGEYNATTGAVVNASLVSGLDNSVGIALSGSNLLVTNNGSGTIGEYNATTGAVVNASLVSGLSLPVGIALSGPNLLVANFNSGTIGEYNATTGAVVNTSLVSGLNGPQFIAVSGSNLFVANANSGTIGEYNATTGAVMNASLVTGLNYPVGIAVSESDLFVVNQNGNTVGEYNATTGAVVNASLVTGLNRPVAIALTESNLLVTNFNGGTIGEYNATTGAVVNAALVPGLSGPNGIAVTGSFPSAPVNGIWTNGAGGNWLVGGNWSGGNVPGVSGYAGDMATFGAAATSGTSVAVTLDTSPQLGAMTFSSASSYVLQGSGTNVLTLSATSGLALVTVSAGSQTIAAPLMLASSTGFAPASGTQLTLSGEISGSGGLSLTAAGVLILCGTNSYTGDTTISGGTLALGNGGTTGSVVGGITNNATLLLDFSGNQPFVNSVCGSGNVVLSGPGTVTLQVPLAPTQTTVNQGQLVVAAGAALSGDLIIGGSGYCTNNGNMSNIRNLTNAGIFLGSVQVSGSFSNLPTGTVRVPAGQTVFLQGALPQSNAGLIQTLGTQTSPAQFESYGPFSNTAGGLIAAQNANLYFDGGLTNQATVAFSYGISNVSGAVANSPSGTISVNGGAGVTFYGDVEQDGTLAVNAVGSTHSSAVFLGTFSGSGGFTGGGDVFIEGNLRPSDPVEVTFGGNAFLANSTNTVMQLAGPVAGMQYDQITVTGQMALAGDLDVELLDGFQPQAGESFQLFEGQLSGSFSQVTLPALSSGLSWNTSNLETNGTISVVPEPSTLLLLGVGAMGLIGWAWRRRFRVAPDCLAR